MSLELLISRIFLIGIMIELDEIIDYELNNISW